ncbi:MAG: phosphodiesterase [Rhodospirillaceae bacterium]|jgi:3',5'-cyclic-AMP phosphodiesterase|nr:phosphodiesterase [Rhodospirillaceae bacterium]
MKIIHLTDTHLVAPPQTLFGLDGRQRLADAVASINAEHADAALCMVTGDLTHWAEPGAYDALIEILGQLSMPWHPLIGNHDTRETARAALPDLPWSADGFLHYTLDTSAGRFVILDTVDTGKAGGRLCEDRLRWLRNELTDSLGQKQDVYLFMHHAPFKVGVNGLDLIRLANGEDLAACLRGFNHVRHLFFGHLHRACHGSWNGIPFSTVKATAHQVALIMDDETPLTGSTENPAYAVCLLEDDRVVIHDHGYLETDTSIAYNRGAPQGEDVPEHQKDWT